MQGAEVRSLVGELRSCLPRGMAKKEKKKEILPFATLMDLEGIMQSEISQTKTKKNSQKQKIE